MKWVVFICVVLVIACSIASPVGSPVTPDYGWRRPVNDYETKFRDARTLAEQILRHPVCRNQFEQLPDWPPGRVLTEVIYGGSMSRTTRAFTNMLDGRIYILVETLRESSTEYMARTLIHELAHAASKSDYDKIRNLDPESDKASIASVKEGNEERVRRVTRICMEAAGIA